jgi:hypothetical protein
MAYTRLYDAELQKITEHRLGATAIMTYLSLTSFDHRNRGYCNPSIDTILEKMNGSYSLSSVEKAFVKLSKSGLIIKGPRSSKKRFRLPVRLSAIVSFVESQKVTEDSSEKVTNPEPVTCEGENRNMLLHNRSNGIDSILYYKPAIDEIRIARTRFPEESFEESFLSTIEANYGKGKAPVKGQIPKLKEILRNSKRRPQQRELDGESKGGKGERNETDSEDLELAQRKRHDDLIRRNYELTETLIEIVRKNEILNIDHIPADYFEWLNGDLYEGHCRVDRYHRYWKQKILAVIGSKP